MVRRYRPVSSRASLSRSRSIFPASSVTKRPAVLCGKTRPSRSSSAIARCIVLGFTPAESASSRTGGSLSPGANSPETMPSMTCRASWTYIGESAAMCHSMPGLPSVSLY